MKIQEQDLYHGAALTQIAEHGSFTALNKGSQRYGHYMINADRHLFVRYSKAEEGPWCYTITPGQLEPVKNILQARARIYFSLVCGEFTVCLLNEEQLRTLIDLASNESQWIRVEVPKGGSCHVSGSLGRLGRMVPHNAFPTALFE